MLGFQGFLLEQLVNNDTHIKISAKRFYIPIDLQSVLDSKATYLGLPPSGRRDLDHITDLQGWSRRLKTRSTRVTAFPAN